MGSASGKTPTEPNLFLYLFFSILRHIKQDKVMLHDLFIYEQEDQKIKHLMLHLSSHERKE